MRNRRVTLGTLPALLMLAAASANAQILAPTTIIFDENTVGSVISANGGNVFEYEESGIRLTAINADPDHFHLFGDDVQIFGSDSSGAVFTAIDGSAFNALSVEVTEVDTPGRLISDNGDVFDIVSTGVFNLNFINITSIDWVFTGSTAGDPSIELDNLIVGPVPEPSGLVLIALGGVACGCRFGRRC